MHCKNCGNIVHHTYCAYCGQRSSVEKITFHYLWHQVFHFFTHLEKGFLFTSLNMVSSPGKTAMAFIRGKRVIYQPPVSYFLIWIAIYALLLYLVKEVFGENTVIDYKNYFGSAVSTQYAINHLGIILSVLFPLFGAYVYLLTSTKLFNYAECLVFVIYALGTIIFAQSVFVILSILYYLITSASVDLKVSDILKILYLFWFSFSLMKQLPLKYRLPRSLLFTILCFGSFSLWRILLYPLLSQKFLSGH